MAEGYPMIQVYVLLVNGVPMEAFKVKGLTAEDMVEEILLALQLSIEGAQGFLGNEEPWDTMQCTIAVEDGIEMHNPIYEVKITHEVFISLTTTNGDKWEAHRVRSQLR